MRNTHLRSWLVIALAIGITACSNPTATTDQALATDASRAVSGTAAIAAGTSQQTIKGFGGANIVEWVGDLTSSQRTKAFSPTSGIGLSVVRVRVPNSAEDFAVEKPTIDACKSFGGVAIASVWSAPASMKTNGSVIKGKIKTSSYADFANHLKAFNTAMGGLAAISPSNEPNIDTDYESMELTASELAAFVAAQGSNCGAPIMAPETFDMNKAFMDSYLSNATAKSKTSYISGHIYGVSPYVYSGGKPIWMTEHITDTNDGNTWSGALNTAKEIHSTLTAGYSMWAWWYIRRSYGLIDEAGEITKRGYAVAHFARYVRPGATKVPCTANPGTGVYTTAYKNGTSLVVVAINQNTTTTYQPFTYSGISPTGFQRYKTTSASNLASDSFTVSGGSFGINLPASSITTLVSY